MLPTFNPENPLLRECPFLVIIEVTEGDRTVRASEIAPKDLLPHTLIGTLFASPTVGPTEVKIVGALLETLGKADNWIGDDSRDGHPIECVITFSDGPAAIAVRVFALIHLMLDDVPADLTLDLTNIPVES